MKWRTAPAAETSPQEESGVLRTDLAVEAHQIASGAAGAEVRGVVSQTEPQDFGSVTRVRIMTEEAGRALGKAPGNYVTIDAPDLPLHDRELQKQVADGLARELVNMINANFGADFRALEDFTTLVCGLGNWNATPDAIGPMVVGKVMVTRHVHSMTPPEKRGGLRSVAAISPGVLGLTGIETAEIVGGVVSRVRPNLIIVVDALASRNVSRLGTTVQLGDSGIQPGSGIGNKRFGITRQAMGVPVIAIGVPTVVHALTIVGDALDILQRGQAPGVAVQQPRLPEDGPPRQAQQVVSQVLQPYFGTLVVTPKEVDVLVKELSDVVAGGINYALHPAIEENEIYQYLQ
jgi:spore protease